MRKLAPNHAGRFSIQHVEHVGVQLPEERRQPIDNTIRSGQLGELKPRHPEDAVICFSHLASADASTCPFASTLQALVSRYATLPEISFTCIAPLSIDRPFQLPDPYSCLADRSSGRARGNAAGFSDFG
jgi:hypothetical protein